MRVVKRLFFDHANHVINYYHHALIAVLMHGLFVLTCFLTVASRHYRRTESRFNVSQFNVSCLINITYSCEILPSTTA